MRVLIIADPGILVPPEGYGGIERIIADLATEYTNQGHDVDLLASEGSKIVGCKSHAHSNAGFPPTGQTVLKAIFYTSFTFSTSPYLVYFPNYLVSRFTAKRLSVRDTLSISKAYS